MTETIRIENSDRGVTLNKSLAWTVGCGLIGAGLYVGLSIATMTTKLDESARGGRGDGRAFAVGNQGPRAGEQLFPAGRAIRGAGKLA